MVQPRLQVKEVTKDYDIHVKYKLSESEEEELKSYAEVANELMGTNAITPEILLRGILEMELLSKSHDDRLDALGNLVAQCRAMKDRANVLNQDT